jgi:hypothetical protein
MAILRQQEAFVHQLYDSGAPSVAPLIPCYFHCHIFTALFTALLLTGKKVGRLPLRTPSLPDPAGKMGLGTSSGELQSALLKRRRRGPEAASDPCRPISGWQVP